MYALHRSLDNFPIIWSESIFISSCTTTEHRGQNNYTINIPHPVVRCPEIIQLHDSIRILIISTIVDANELQVRKAYAIGVYGRRSGLVNVLHAIVITDEAEEEKSRTSITYEHYLQHF